MSDGGGADSLGRVRAVDRTTSWIAARPTHRVDQSGSWPCLSVFWTARIRHDPASFLTTTHRKMPLRGGPGWRLSAGPVRSPPVRLTAGQLFSRQAADHTRSHGRPWPMHAGLELEAGVDDSIGGPVAGGRSLRASRAANGLIASSPHSSRDGCQRSHHSYNRFRRGSDVTAGRQR